MWNVLMHVLDKVLCCMGVGNSNDIRKSFHIKDKIQVCHTNLHNIAFRCHKCRVIDYFLYSKYPCSISAASNEQQATVLPTVVVA